MSDYFACLDLISFKMSSALLALSPVGCATGCYLPISTKTGIRLRQVYHSRGCGCCHLISKSVQRVDSFFEFRCLGGGGGIGGGASGIWTRIGGVGMMRAQVQVSGDGGTRDIV